MEVDLISYKQIALPCALMRGLRCLLAFITACALFPLAHATQSLTIADGGALHVEGKLFVDGANITVKAGGTLTVKAGSLTTADGMEIEQSGLLSGSGTIDTSLTNRGTVLIDGGSTIAMEFIGVTTNEGDFVVRNGSVLAASTSTFTNNGALDMRDGDATLPLYLVNNGRILPPGSTETLATILGISVNPSSVEIAVKTSQVYTYHLEYSIDLNHWFDASPLLPGGSGLDAFVDNNGPATASKRFYRLAEE